MLYKPAIPSPLPDTNYAPTHRRQIDKDTRETETEKKTLYFTVSFLQILDQ